MPRRATRRIEKGSTVLPSAAPQWQMRTTPILQPKSSDRALTSDTVLSSSRATEMQAMRSSQYPKAFFRSRWQEGIFCQATWETWHQSQNSPTGNCGLINSVPFSSIFSGSFCRWLPNINKGTDKKITTERNSFIRSFTPSLIQYLNTHYALRGACADPIQSQRR